MPSSSVYICPSLSDPRGGSFKGGSIIAGYGWSCLNKVDRQSGRNRKAARLNDLYPTVPEILVFEGYEFVFGTDSVIWCIYFVSFGVILFEFWIECIDGYIIILLHHLDTYLSIDVDTKILN